ncbi:MAG: DUF2793 domain-containing protein [Sphingomicrobium sp.]
MGQSQKELFHNEALQLLDVIVAAAVEGAPLSAPPFSPAVGSCYLIGPSPTGFWIGRQNQLAVYTSGGWRFVTPPEGMTALVKSSSLTATFRAGAWEIGTVTGAKFVVGGQQVVGSRAAAIASPAGGATVDSQSRSVIGLILAAMRQHGLIEP